PAACRHRRGVWRQDRAQECRSAWLARWCSLGLVSAYFRVYRWTECQPLACNMARPRRFERPTPAFGGQYSIQLSYGREDRHVIRNPALDCHARPPTLARMTNPPRWPALANARRRDGPERVPFVLAAARGVVLGSVARVHLARLRAFPDAFL